ncbi:MAG: hypothetical protein HRU22_12635 [Gammaproteobacteria bacterium]|nr:hypothetical protein [Gammaproteobacteria bacterium]
MSKRCQSCGVPTDTADLCQQCAAEIKKYNIKPPAKPSSKFRIFFVVLVLFCAIMIVYLPR